MNSPELQQKTFLLMLIAVSLAFGWILLPFYGAVFWGSVLAIIFTPFYRWLLVILNQRQNLAALTTLLLCLIMVILPFTLIAASLLQEVLDIYQRIKSGELNFGAYFQQIMGALPSWMVNFLDSMGLTNISELKDMLSNGALQGSQLIATEALNMGQNTFHFIISFGIMLYLLFFLLRDGTILSTKIKQAIPLSMEYKRHLFSKFTTVVRATVKGNIAVAAVQGTLGGVMFSFLGIQGALLWGFVMAFLSLVPAVGAGLIWAPVAIYFLLTGALWQGITLIAFGVLVIGMVDNVLRPILVGKDTQLPDYVVLISTLGGMVVFGLNGFVIGPVIAALFISGWDLFSSNREASKD
ncbi:putative PurR-regulated permease PerM [Nitrosospira sp. Nsp5]|uniref:Predicted PurR-regulated permease PerM n=1 Tax=Nitrosospira multiformis TaxID=1231 RepID=A0ABY0TJQ8_9PROT|nr:MULTISPECIES: AI-2E family transporter [Nitrosospira]PTR10234.1 putative PurR-regulated permease PerM [Nitrosospira sp. Nsp5]SDQ94594.1 Predicted PurR-regulated permease PerM [Nitrosospira multiformis]